MNINTEEWAGLRWLADHVGVPKSSLLDAATAGHVAWVQFPCGDCKYSIADTVKYAANRPKRGRPLKNPG